MTRLLVCLLAVSLLALTLVTAFELDPFRKDSTCLEGMTDRNGICVSATTAELNDHSFASFPDAEFTQTGNAVVDCSASIIRNCEQCVSDFLCLKCREGFTLESPKTDGYQNCKYNSSKTVTALAALMILVATVLVV